MFIAGGQKMDSKNVQDPVGNLVIPASDVYFVL